MSENAGRLNKRDWQIINAALALAEADWDADDDAVRPGLARRAAETRQKVHAQLARYSDPYRWDSHRAP